jgi:hypothetical protein
MTDERDAVTSAARAFFFAGAVSFVVVLAAGETVGVGAGVAVVGDCAVVCLRVAVVARRFCAEVGIAAPSASAAISVDLIKSFFPLIQT